VAGGEEFFAGFVHGIGLNGEEDAAGIAGDEIEAAILLDELEARIHGRRGASVLIRSIHRSGEEINRDLQRGDGNPDLYQIGTEADEGKTSPRGVGVDGEDAARKAERSKGCGPAAHKRVEDQVAFGGGGEEDAF